MFGICSTIRKRAKITLDTTVETTTKLDPHCILNVNNINLEVSAIKNCEKMVHLGIKRLVILTESK